MWSPSASAPPLPCLRSLPSASTPPWASWPSTYSRSSSLVPFSCSMPGASSGSAWTVAPAALLSAPPVSVGAGGRTTWTWTGMKRHQRPLQLASMSKRWSSGGRQATTAALAPRSRCCPMGMGRTRSEAETRPSAVVTRSRSVQAAEQWSWPRRSTPRTCPRYFTQPTGPSCCALPSAGRSSWPRSPSSHSASRLPPLWRQSSTRPVSFPTTHTCSAGTTGESSTLHQTPSARHWTSTCGPPRTGQPSRSCSICTTPCGQTSTLRVHPPTSGTLTSWTGSPRPATQVRWDPTACLQPTRTSLLLQLPSWQQKGPALRTTW
mmetsp:Transcript_28511/g.92433  ORF Transcript_28511/g.92433 Transcript_28511/m.92433 type:complete len:320 (+) Transcript_28511:1364-2323(+)